MVTEHHPGKFAELHSNLAASEVCLAPEFTLQLKIMQVGRVFLRALGCQFICSS